jgi:uncharacterized protein YodC (DUF2158 family)
MPAQAWKARPGDPVRLKSGGVVMTAERVNHGGEPPFARCVWLDARQVLHTAFIALDALALVEDAGTDDGTDCPETRMVGGQDQNNNKISRLR